MLRWHMVCRTFAPHKAPLHKHTTPHSARSKNAGAVMSHTLLVPEPRQHHGLQTDRVVSLREEDRCMRGKHRLCNLSGLVMLAAGLDCEIDVPECNLSPCGHRCPTLYYKHVCCARVQTQLAGALKVDSCVCHNLLGSLLGRLEVLKELQAMLSICWPCTRPMRQDRKSNCLPPKRPRHRAPNRLLG